MIAKEQAKDILYNVYNEFENEIDTYDYNGRELTDDDLSMLFDFLNKYMNKVYLLIDEQEYLSNKEKFLNYCKMYETELIQLNKEIMEDDFFSDELGTLKDLGYTWSFELANIGFELGYASWSFKVHGTSFSEIKESFLDTIMENEKIENVYTDERLEKIAKRIKEC